MASFRSSPPGDIGTAVGRILGGKRSACPARLSGWGAPEIIVRISFNFEEEQLTRVLSRDPGFVKLRSKEYPFYRFSELLHVHTAQTHRGSVEWSGQCLISKYATL